MRPTNRNSYSALQLASLAFVFCSMLLSTSGVFAQNPSHKDGLAPISIRDAEYSEALKEEASALYRKSYDAIEDFKKTEQTRGADKLSDSQLCKTWVDLKNLERIAEILTIHGETAGIDFSLRQRQLFGVLKKLVQSFYTHSNNAKTIEKLTALAGKQSPARNNEAKLLAEMISKGEWEKAEQRMVSAKEKVSGQFAVLNPITLGLIYQPFEIVFGKISAEMTARRTRNSRALADAQLAKEKPNFAGILTNIDSAITSIGTDGSASWNGATVNGPELITKIGDEWALAQVKTFRCRNLEWYLGSSVGSGLVTGEGDLESEYAANNTSDTTSGFAAQTPTVKAFDDFSIEIIKRLAAVIVADAGRATDVEVEKLYPAYLISLGPIQRVTFTDLEPRLSGALAQLAAKSPRLKMSIENYAKATDELLRWRKRTADSTAKSKQESYPLISDVHFKATRSRTAEYTGLYPVNEADVRDAKLLTSAPYIVLSVIDVLMGQRVTFPDVVRWHETNPTLIGRYHNRVYGTIPEVNADIVDRYVRRLKTELMVDDKNGPLSFAAATAISSMSRSDLRNVGGSIEGLFLESHVTRFGALPDGISEITPLGWLPVEPLRGSATPHVLMRYTILPEWVQFDHAFVDLTKEQQDPGATGQTKPPETNAIEEKGPDDK